MDEILHAEMKDLTDYCIQLKDYFHKNPELSGKEYQTSEYIKNNLIEDNLIIENVSETGFIAILDSGKPGKTIALRSELDALPIKESTNNLKTKKKVISDTDGLMHACGHDGHMAILLTTMKFLNSHIDKLQGRIIFIFEEGEEQATGIDAMVSHLKKYKIDAIYGNHLFSDLATGKICVSPGSIMAGAGIISMKVVGQGGHASRPDLAKNPLIAATNIINECSVLWNYRRDITKTVSLGFSQIHSGNQNNVIADEAYIGGTVRFFDIEEGRNSIGLIKKTASSVAAFYDCSVIFDDSMELFFPPVVNDQALAQLAKNILKEQDQTLIETNVKWFASETFANYSEIAPSLFSLVGINNSGKGTGADHHNAHFEIDDDSIILALDLMIKFVIGFLKE